MIRKLLARDCSIEVLFLDYRYHSLDENGQHVHVHDDFKPSVDLIRDDLYQMQAQLLSKTEYAHRPWHVYGVSMGSYIATRFILQVQDNGQGAQIASLTLDCPFRDIVRATAHASSEFIASLLRTTFAIAPYINNEEQLGTETVLRRILSNDDGRTIALLVFKSCEDDTCPPEDGEFLATIGVHNEKKCFETHQRHASSEDDEESFYPRLLSHIRRATMNWRFHRWNEDKTDPLYIACSSDFQRFKAEYCKDGWLAGDLMMPELHGCELNTASDSGLGHLSAGRMRHGAGWVPCRIWFERCAIAPASQVKMVGCGIKDGRPALEYDREHIEYLVDEGKYHWCDLQNNAVIVRRPSLRLPRLTHATQIGTSIEGHSLALARFQHNGHQVFGQHIMGSSQACAELENKLVCSSVFDTLSHGRNRIVHLATSDQIPFKCMGDE